MLCATGSKHAFAKLIIMYRTTFILMTAALLAGCFNPNRSMTAEETETDSDESELTDPGANPGSTSVGPGSTSEVSAGSSSSTPGSSSPTSISTTDTIGSTTDVETTTDGTVRCSAPQQLSSFPTSNQTQGVALQGGFAYVTETNRGVHVIDISDPSDVSQNGDVDLPNPRGIAARGDFVFVADPTGLIAVDVSEPNDPLAYPALSMNAGVNSVEVVGDRAYAVTDANGEPCPGCGLHIVDVSNPTSMTVVGEIALGSAFGIAVEGSTAFVGTAGGLAAVDLSSSSVLDTAPVGGFVADVAVVGDTAYVAAGTGGMEIFDVSDPANIAQLGAIGGDFVLGVAVEDDWAWLADGAPGIRVIDVSDPTAPTELAFVDTLGNTSDIALDNGIAFVTSWDSGLHVFAPPLCR